MKTLIRPLFLTMMLMSSAAMAEPALTLKQQWQVGKRYTQSMKMEQSTKMAAGPAKMDQKVSMNTELTLAVTAHEDRARKRIALKYTRMTMDMNMGAATMSFDSAKPGAASDPMANPFAAMVGKEFRLLTDASGQVTEFENFDAIMKEAGSANPMAAAAINKESILQLLRQNTLLALPAQPVVPGDSWPFRVEVPLPQIGKITLKGNYLFKQMSQHDGAACAVITFRGSLDADLAGADAKSPAAQMGIKIESGTLSGTIWFDNTLGAARATEMVQEMTMVMANPLKAGESLKIPTRQAISTSLTKVEALP